ncbi:3-isopropylmalate dehydratase small subunit [Cupriavidus basilensis]|uniref:3-isopropylmalate dehydratase small subunit n=1 Tax=Cupriavidus basilensis TaxID=68895 RepID=A0ABT6AT84_9BURK|nr:3-isopropylmalate dehydratase small subunit [Cupriavidus basilensis]MDF3835836.1 3-isopropylmalate dehydratase small subunit [Cupriavidus basilensis]
MEQFVELSGIAAPLVHANIDTDLLIPSREITSPGRDGYGEKLLAPWRYQSSADGERVERPDFVLNRAPFRQASILLTGENFGSGSSREAAAWAVRQFGFRCVIAPSFGAIFQNNCYRNGILPVVLPAAEIDWMAAEAAAGTLILTVDLERCVVRHPQGRCLPFTVPRSERSMLLEGLDAIGLTLKRRAQIQAFQHADRAARPWIWTVDTPQPAGELPP